jgi:hypothetical protein
MKTLQSLIRLAAVACTLSFGLAANAQATPQLRAWLQKDNSPADETTRDIAYRVAKVNLGPSTNAFVVYLSGSAICGSGGCGMEILVPEGKGFRTLASTTITQMPIRILDSQTNGLHDIGVLVAGGGVTHGYEARLRFNGKRYPSNPSLAPPSHNPPGDTVLDEHSLAIPLFP